MSELIIGLGRGRSRHGQKVSGDKGSQEAEFDLRKSSNKEQGNANKHPEG